MRDDLATVAEPEPTLDQAAAEQLLRWAAERHPGKAVLSVSFGGSGLVLAHMVSRLELDLPVVFLDTGLHFAETYAFRNAFTARYGLRRIDLEPAEDVGPLYRTDPDRCCQVRKVIPMARLLEQFDCWVTALRRDQSAERQSVRVHEWVELDSGRRVRKLNLLAGWTRDQAEAYLDRYEVPRHPLADRGYQSIGCWPCTRPVELGGSERGGRWRGREKTECGLHTPLLETTVAVAS
jgi:phosphoadenosine phosphosulfate reductase